MKRRVKRGIEENETKAEKVGRLEQMSEVEVWNPARGESEGVKPNRTSRTMRLYSLCASVSPIRQGWPRLGSRLWQLSVAKVAITEQPTVPVYSQRLTGANVNRDLPGVTFASPG